MKPKSHPMLLTKNQMKQEVDRLTTELQLITSQRNELQDHLTFISEDTMDNRPYHKPNPFYEKLKLEHAQVVSELRTLEVDYTDTSEKFGELTKETVFYHLHSWLLMEQTQLEKKLYMLRQEKMKLLDDWMTGSY
uniref:disks large homolog 5-like n=1 Tax=Myodes glareolus TaxID=447135 RepID=UPI002020FE3D|nr:disks large homolog 5-like [Myodes glareolus]